MAWPLVNSVSAAPGAAGGASAAIDTTGADLLVVFVSRYVGGATPVVSDNYGNTWTPLTAYSGSVADAEFFYSPAPVVGPGHVFTVASSGGLPAFAALAFSGSTPLAPFGAESGAAPAGGQVAVTPGSVTPSVAGALVVTGLSWDGNSGGDATVDSGFTVVEQVPYGNSNNEGVAVAYLAQGAAAAADPTWSIPNFVNAAAALAVFKPAAGGGTTVSGSGIASGRSSPASVGRLTTGATGRLVGRGSAASVGTLRATSSAAGRGLSAATGAATLFSTALGCASGRGFGAGVLPGGVTVVASGCAAGRGTAASAGRLNATAAGAVTGRSAGVAAPSLLVAAPGVSVGRGSAASLGRLSIAASGAAVSISVAAGVVPGPLGPGTRAGVWVVPGLARTWIVPAGGRTWEVQSP